MDFPEDMGRGVTVIILAEAPSVRLMVIMVKLFPYLISDLSPARQA